MNLCMVGCTHRDASVDVRARLAFGSDQTDEALQCWQRQFPEAELVLLSTCNRVELYAAGNGSVVVPPGESLTDALLGFRQTPRSQVEGRLLTLADRDVVAHVYRVAASLDSMVVGEPQILAQVKRAYQQAQQAGAAGPLMHDLFQSALRTARRVAGETELHKHRVSIPSVAIGDFARRIFERFDDKHVFVLGAGEMASETLQYLREAGAESIYVANRNADRGKTLASEYNGEWVAWDDRWMHLAAADLVVSATGAEDPIVAVDAFDKLVAPQRLQRPLFVLDLAVPRDFEPAVGDRLGVYLYSLDDLKAACERNAANRASQLPLAERIVRHETDRFVAAAHHRVAAPVITGLRRELEQPKQAELERLFQKLPELDERARAEVQQFADRLVNKMLHPPLESLRDASREGPPHGLLDALKRLFRLED